MVKLNIVTDSGQTIYRNWQESSGGPAVSGPTVRIQTAPPTAPTDINPVFLTTALLDRFSPPGKKSFIETGTYKAETIWRAIEYGFKVALSCDLTFKNVDLKIDEKIAEIQKSDPSRRLKLVLGDSPDCIPILLRDEVKTIFSDPKDQEVVFFLDAHASGELGGGRSGGSPLVDELKAIGADDIKTHTIFIGNRRLFDSAEWSFLKEQDVLDALKQINPDYKIHIINGYIPNDMIVASVYDNG